MKPKLYVKSQPSEDLEAFNDNSAAADGDLAVNAATAADVGAAADGVAEGAAPPLCVYRRVQL